MWRFCGPRCQDKSWMAWQIIWHQGMYPMFKCCKLWFWRGCCIYLFCVWLSNYLLDSYMVLIAKEMSYLNLWLQLLDKKDAIFVEVLTFHIYKHSFDPPPTSFFHSFATNNTSSICLCQFYVAFTTSPLPPLCVPLLIKMKTTMYR
jgi:hypothetical protein